MRKRRSIHPTDFERLGHLLVFYGGKSVHSTRSVLRLLTWSARTPRGLKSPAQIQPEVSGVGKSNFWSIHGECANVAGFSVYIIWPVLTPSLSKNLRCWCKSIPKESCGQVKPERKVQFVEHCLSWACMIIPDWSRTSYGVVLANSRHFATDLIWCH